MALYADANGGLYSKSDVAYKLETGAWTAHAWDDVEGALIVETSDNHLVWLVTIDEDILSDRFDAESVTDDRSLEDTSEP